MLLLTRRVGEGLVINGTISVQVLAVQGGRVKLGVEYPAGNTVFRQEVFAKIRAENQAAALPAGPAPQPPAALANAMATAVAKLKPLAAPASTPTPKKAT